MDIIHIKNLEVFANHGVFEEENPAGTDPAFLEALEFYMEIYSEKPFPI